MMIGQRLDNPYNVNNMRAAYDSLVKSGEPINVHINNAPLIENIAINSKSFSEVKTKLLQKITDGALKNVSTSSINTLFESYE